MVLCCVKQVDLLIFVANVRYLSQVPNILEIQYTNSSNIIIFEYCDNNEEALYFIIIVVVVLVVVVVIIIIIIIIFIISEP